MAELTHGMNCPALSPGSDDDCTCGLQWRVEIDSLNCTLEDDEAAHQDTLRLWSEAKAEIERLKRGDFTPEEFQGLCHREPPLSFCDFTKGCHEYQRELFGKSDRDESRNEIERLKKLIDRDKTGLANALNAVRQVIRSYFWIPAGEWGSYEWDERTEKVFRAEVGRCFDEADKVANDALKKSGDLANEAFNPKKPSEEDQAFAAISKARVAALKLGIDFDELMLKGRRCETCQSVMVHTRLGGYRCFRGCQ